MLPRLLLACLALLLRPTAALNVVPRRLALRVGAAALVSPAVPAMAKSKKSINPNKQEGLFLDKKFREEFLQAEKASIQGDKGSRGVASASFEKNDTVNKNRLENKGVAKDARGRTIANANRNRRPEDLGLKQWDGK